MIYRGIPGDRRILTLVEFPQAPSTGYSTAIPDTLHPLALMFLVASFLAFSACGSFSKGSDAQAYAQEMQSLFVENKAIGREFFDVTVLVKKQELNTPEIAARFAERVVPRAADLAEKVDAVEPGTSGLEQVHSGIERAWAIRAESYAALSKAWTDADNAAFTRALHDNRSVRKAEERYIEAANRLLLEHEVQLDPYP